MNDRDDIYERLLGNLPEDMRESEFLRSFLEPVAAEMARVYEAALTGNLVLTPDDLDAMGLSRQVNETDGEWQARAQKYLGFAWQPSRSYSPPIWDPSGDFLHPADFYFPFHHFDREAPWQS